MSRIALISRRPEPGSTIAPEVKMTFFRDLIDISLPLFVNKHPQNPVNGGTDGDTTT